MRKITFTAIIAGISLMACNNGEQEAAPLTLTNNMDSVSYAIGTGQAKGMLAQIPELNITAFMRGYQDFADSADLQITETESQAIIQSWSQIKQAADLAAKQKESEAMYGANKELGEKFLEENKTKPGIEVTATGLQYEVLKKGTGKQPEATSNVKVHYTGMFTDGTVFESSVERGEPIDFMVGQVIPGWTEGLQLMKEGAKYKFYIPQELAYGANPNPQSAIKPYQVLVFEVELLKINN